MEHVCGRIFGCVCTSSVRYVNHTLRSRLHITNVYVVVDDDDADEFLRMDESYGCSWCVVEL